MSRPDPRAYCHRCFSPACRCAELEAAGDLLPTPRVPLETPGHSGPYRGTLPVRVIPAGVCSESPGFLSGFSAAASRAGLLAQSRLRGQLKSIGASKPGRRRKAARGPSGPDNPKNVSGPVPEKSGPSAPKKRVPTKWER